MSFIVPRLALVSLSLLSLSVLSGCSNSGKDFNASSQVYSQEASTRSVADPFDSYYGSPNNHANQIDRQYNINSSVKAKPLFKVNAPKRYIVKKGDTLWGISNLFLNNPAYWPEIWDVNQKIKNPHRIYPGDVLFIYEGGKRNVRQASGGFVEKRVARMRIERKGSGEPISTLMPFLVWPRALDKQTIETAPYIVAGENANLLIEKGQTVYAKNLSDRHAGGRYAIFHVGKKLVDPNSKRDLGNEVIYTGYLEVEQPALHADVATALVEESIREIRPGDRLLSVKDETNTLSNPILIPKRKVRGSIISLFNANMMTGQTMVITVNKGARDGFKLGYTLGVYSPGRIVNDPIKKAKRKYEFMPVVPAEVSLPPARVATAIVYKVQNNISYALITESVNTVKNGYKIGNP